MLIWLPYLATVAIMLAAAWLLKRGCRNAARPFDRLDRLADLTRETVSERLGHQNYAWPPGPTGHAAAFIASGEYACGCVITTTPDGVHITACPPHDPQFVTEWEQRLAQ